MIREIFFILYSLLSIICLFFFVFKDNFKEKIICGVYCIYFLLMSIYIFIQISFVYIKKLCQ